MSWPVPPVLPGERLAVEGGGPRFALQLALPGGRQGAPLLMLHGLDGAASAAMLAPLFVALAAGRPVAAPDLPGFGASARPGLVPEPRMLVRAVLRSAAHLRRHGLAQVPDLLAVGDACELAALAAVAAPRAFRSVLLVSPTGLEGARAEGYSDGRTHAHPLARALLAAGPPAAGLVRLATAGPLLEAHLRHQWGRHAPDAAWLAHARACLQAPGAARAALAWAGGTLATRGIAEVMARIARPVWMARGRHAPTPDTGALSRIGPPSHWMVDVFDTGPLPFREQPAAFVERLQHFSGQLDAACPPTRHRTARLQPESAAVGKLSIHDAARP